MPVRCVRFSWSGFCDSRTGGRGRSWRGRRREAESLITRAVRVLSSDYTLVSSRLGRRALRTGAPQSYVPTLLPEGRVQASARCSASGTLWPRLSTLTWGSEVRPPPPSPSASAATGTWPQQPLATTPEPQGLAGTPTNSVFPVHPRQCWVLSEPSILGWPREALESLSELLRVIFF